MRDPYLAKKYNRPKQLADKARYINEYCPEVKQLGDDWIVDVGPGFGVFLEYCRHYGRCAFGVEATVGAGGMGDNYLALARLLHKRQSLGVVYQGFYDFVVVMLLCGKKLPGSIALFNFQGSWAQCHADYLGGPPHHDSGQQSWQFGPELYGRWLRNLALMRHCLMPGGHILISANRTGDQDCQERYVREMRNAADDAGLKLVMHKELVLKWGLA